MTKIQKTYLWIAGLMVLIPEILWNPVSNIYYALLQTNVTSNTVYFRNSFLQDSNNIFSLKITIFTQLMGVIFIFSRIITRKFDNLLIKMIVSFIFLFLVLVIFMALYLVMNFSINIF